MLRYCPLSALFALALPFVFYAGCATSERTAMITSKSRPVTFEVPSIGGKRISLQRLRGKPVVVFMFTTWSLRSQLEAPQFVQLHERKPGLILVGIALDYGNRKLVETYIKYVGFRFDVAHLVPSDRDLVAAFGPVRQVPRTVVLDRSGRVVQVHSGMTDFAQLDEVLDMLLRR